MKELQDFCRNTKVNEIYLIKSNKNNIFIDKLLKEIDKIKKWSGPHLHIIQNVQRVENTRR